MRSALLVAVFALLAVPARAQTNDMRWEPWLGCWNLAVDNLRPRETPEDVAGAAPRPATAWRTLWRTLRRSTAPRASA